MSRLARLYETLRRLRPSQPAHRLVRALRRRAGRTPPPAKGVFAGLAPLPPESRRPAHAPFDRALDGAEAARWSFAGAPAHVTAEGALVFERGEPSALERYHAAYAEVVRARAEAGDLNGAARWLRALLAAETSPAHPYVRARRVLALVEARGHGLVEAEPVLLADAAALAAEVERDVGGNHLLANAVALHRAGHAFRGAAARGWAELGRTLLSACARTQVLADGVHYERSPAYQGLVLEHVLTALETAASVGRAPPAGVEDAAKRLAAALSDLVLPDGALLARGDGAPGLSLPVPALLAWAGRRAGPASAPRGETRLFPAAGIAIAEDAATRSAITLVACAPCPRDLPAHGHADALAVEVVLFGRRVIASAGTAAYGSGPERDADRRPGAFAGVLVDGRAPADPYDAFRVGARGWVRRLARWDEDGVASIEAYGDGFATPGDPVVHRRLVALCDGVAVVLDEWTGRGGRAIDLAWPVGPGIAVTLDAHGARLADGAATWRWWASEGSPTLAEGHVATELGVRAPRTVLWNRVAGERPRRCVHALARGDAPLRVAVTPVPGGGLRVDVAHGEARRAFHVMTGHAP